MGKKWKNKYIFKKTKEKFKQEKDSIYFIDCVGLTYK